VFKLPGWKRLRRATYAQPGSDVVFKSTSRPALRLITAFFAASFGFLTVSPLIGQTVIWSGVDATNNVNTDWSDPNNWSGGTPGASENVCFFNAGADATQGVIDNIVDVNTAILSLEFGNTNGFHTTQINSGITLTVSNAAAANLVFVGTGTDNGENQTLYATMKGPGTFNVIGANSGSVFSVQQTSASNGTHLATLDLSGLSAFNLTAGRLLVGGNGGATGNLNWPSGTLYLAATNVIRLNGASPAMDVGDGPDNGGAEKIYLGQTNALYVDSITIARQKCTATVIFNPSLAGSNPVWNLAGNTNSRVTALAVGDFSAQSTSASTVVGTLNLGGGTANSMVNTCYVGCGQSGSGPGPTTGTLNLGPGSFNVNVLNVGYLSTNIATGKTLGIVTVTNGELVINSNLLLGYNPGATASVSGTLAITNGSVFANEIISGGGTAAIAMNGGTLVVSNSMGTPTAPLTSLSLSNSPTLEFWVTHNATNAAVNTITSDNTGVISIGGLPIITAYPSQFPLIYCPAGGANGVRFTAGTLPGSYTGFISNDNSAVVWLVITNGPALPKTDQWAGAVNHNWDTNSLNWTNNGIAIAYSEGDLVVFNDLAQTGAITLTGVTPHRPDAWTVSNNLINYAFSGSNSVSGPIGLVKSGTASVTLSESGDSFTGGITVDGGMVVLDEPSSSVSGGLFIGSSGAAQIGNNDTNGALPGGTIANYGALIFDQTGTNLATANITGTGSLTQKGAGKLLLNASNSYSGSTFILDGTLTLTGAGAIASSSNVIVSSATIDVSAVTGPATLNHLEMTNAAINLAATNINVEALTLGGVTNTINILTRPGSIFAYPTNITLIESSAGISGYNFVLGSLPAANPPYAGTLAQNGNTVVLSLTNGPLAIVAATVTFSATNAGLPLNPAFCGLSYEKSELTGSLFVSTDASLISMFSQIGPAVLRIGGNSVDTTCWGGVSNLTPITASDVSAFAGFVKALPPNWHVIYGVNMSVNSPTNCAAEAAYVANALGNSLLGFEIGNEPDLYYENGIRASGFTYSQYLSQWQALAAAITNTVPGWAITNGGNGWTLTGPASADNTAGYTVPFAGNEAGVISMVTQHYYVANGQSPSSTIALLLQGDPNLPGTVRNIVAAANSARLPFGFRMAECGSFYNGGAPGISDAYGAALWAIDFMCICATNGCQGINFHGGGDGTGYTPIADNGTAVVQARPEFYGLKFFSLLPPGNIVPATVTVASNLNFSAYGVRQTNGTMAAVLNNKDTNNEAEVSVNLGTNVTVAQWTELAGANLSETNGYTLGGAIINSNGSWAGGVQGVIPATNGELTVIVPPFTAMLLTVPSTNGTNLNVSLRGGELQLTWPSSYTGWSVQSNSVSLRATNDWLTVPGSSATNSVQIPISPSATNVFYRMVLP
jgi:autotransporter-associated beta strand protein